MNLYKHFSMILTTVLNTINAEHIFAEDLFLAKPTFFHMLITLITLAKGLQLD